LVELAYHRMLLFSEGTVAPPVSTDVTTSWEMEYVVPVAIGTVRFAVVHGTPLEAGVVPSPEMV
jgi:hypothetical protein